MPRRLPRRSYWTILRPTRERPVSAKARCDIRRLSDEIPCETVARGVGRNLRESGIQQGRVMNLGDSPALNRATSLDHLIPNHVFASTMEPSSCATADTVTPNFLSSVLVREVAGRRAIGARTARVSALKSRLRHDRRARLYLHLARVGTHSKHANGLWA